MPTTKAAIAAASAVAHIADTTDAHDASAISIVDAGTLITATEVEGALQEIAAASASAHIADATDAHDASAVSFDDTGLTITAADVQTMGEQLDAAISAGGIPATIFDARGDIIRASAADTAERLALGASGTRLTSDGTDAVWQGLVGCKVYKTTQTVTDNYLAFDAEYWDPQTMHDNVTENTKIIIPTGYGGYYQIQASCFTGTTTATRLEVHLNGTAVPGRGSNGAPTGNYVSCLSLVALVATDYIQIKGSSGGSTQYGDAGVAGDYLVVSVTRIGV